MATLEYPNPRGADVSRDISSWRVWELEELPGYARAAAHQRLRPAVRAICVFLNDVRNRFDPWVLACARMTTGVAHLTNLAGRHDEGGCRQLPTQFPEAPRSRAGAAGDVPMSQESVSRNPPARENGGIQGRRFAGGFGDADSWIRSLLRSPEESLRSW